MIQAPFEIFPVIWASHHSDDTSITDHGRLPLFPSLPGSLTPIDRDLEGSLMADNLAHPYNRRKFLAVHWHHCLMAAG